MPHSWQDQVEFDHGQTILSANGQDPYPRKLGSTMTLLAWISFLLVLTVLFGKLLDQQVNPNDVVQSRISGNVTEVVLRQNRAGHYVATALFNEIEVDVIIDTGASDVSVPSGLANRLGLVRGRELAAVTANGTIPVYQTLIDSIELGDIVVNNVRANINPYMDDNFVLLGMSFLQQLEFTHLQGRLILKQY